MLKVYLLATKLGLIQRLKPLEFITVDYKLAAIKTTVIFDWHHYTARRV